MKETGCATLLKTNVYEHSKHSNRAFTTKFYLALSYAALNFQASHTLKHDKISFVYDQLLNL